MARGRRRLSLTLPNSHAFSQEVPQKFRRDMGYNTKEFFRLLSAAIGDNYSFLQNNEQVVISHNTAVKSLQLTLTTLPDRVLGSFRIEHIEVEFGFEGFDAQERGVFMHRFDRRYQRGGG